MHVTDAEQTQFNEQDDRQLIDYLMRRFSKKVLALAYYHVRDRHLAEDIVQEVFFRVYQNLGKFRQESSYYTWIYRITVNLCRDYAKSAYARRVLPWNAKAQPTDDAALFEEVEGGDVFRLVMDLPDKYRTAIALFYFEDTPTPEIAHMLNLSEAAVRTRLHRGRNLLKQSLTLEGIPYE